MNAVLSNPNHPEYGVATIPFPIPKADYDNCIALLTALEVGDVLAADCMVEEIYGNYPVLQRLVNSAINVDELDYLVKRMDSFDKRELGQFSALAVSQNIGTMKDFINLTFCCQNITVVQDFSDLKRIGEFCNMDRNGGTMPQNDMLYMDFEKVALNLLQNKDGKVTPYGVIYDKDFQMEQLYDGRHFPEYHYEDSIMELEVTTAENAVANIASATFYLPMSERQLERALLRNNLADSGDTELRFMDSDLPEEADALLDFTEESVHDLNALCQAVADFSEGDMAKYRAAVLFTEPASAVELTNLAEQLDLFDFHPGIRSAEEYGKHMICESGHFEYDENLEEFYDFKKYGSARVEQEYGKFTDSGYISYHGVVSFPELLAGVNCERMEMGGMA